MKRTKTISIVVPCFNEQENIVDIYQELKKVIKKISKYRHELIFVDNGSVDKSRELISKIARKDKSVVGIFLSRNFGPEASAWAGMMHAKGNAIILIECDLQNPPNLIPGFIKKWEQGYHSVVGIYDKAVDSFLITLLRKIFYRIFKKITSIDVPINATGFGLIDKKVLLALKNLPEKYRFYRGLRSWVGFKTSYITYQRQERKKGQSSYNFFNYIQHAERGIFGFSYLLLDLIIYAGFILVALAFIFIVFYLLAFLIFGNPIKGSITILVSIIFFGGAQMLAISVLGKYVQVIVEESKSRPVYIVDKTINFSGKK